LDEHLPKAVAQGLRRHGIVVQTAPEAGLLGQPDSRYLEYSHAGGWAVVTYDDDYLGLHAAQMPHAGIAFSPKALTVGELIKDLLLMYECWTRAR